MPALAGVHYFLGGSLMFSEGGIYCFLGERIYCVNHLIFQSFQYALFWVWSVICSACVGPAVGLHDTLQLLDIPGAAHLHSLIAGIVPCMPDVRRNVWQRGRWRRRMRRRGSAADAAAAAPGPAGGRNRDLRLLRAPSNVNKWLGVYCH